MSEREANQQRVDAAAQRVRIVIDGYSADHEFRKDVELLIEIALAPVLEIFAAQPAATPMAALPAKWRKECPHGAIGPYSQGLMDCAEELETALAAAQPQRESEPPEQVARLTEKILTELFKQYSGKEAKSFRHALRRTLEPIMRAALSPQTDSLEPK